jgi:hypothetical protein
LDTNGDGLISMAEFLEYFMVNTTSTRPVAQNPAAEPSSSSSGGGGNSSSSSSSAVWSTLRAASAGPAVGFTPGRQGGSSGSSSSSSGFGLCRQQPPLGVPSAASWHSSSSSYSSVDRSWNSSRQMCRSYGSRAAASSATSVAENESNSDSSSSSSMQSEEETDVGGSSSYGSSSSSSGQQQLSPGLRRPDTNLFQQDTDVEQQQDVAMAAAAAAAAAGATASNMPVVMQQVVAAAVKLTGSEQDAVKAHGVSQLQQQQQQLPESAEEPLNDQQQQQQESQPQHSRQWQQDDVAYQQQLEMDLSYEEDTQEQRRQIRRQQQLLPSLLEDAAAARTPCYVLTPLPSSSSTSTMNTRSHPSIAAAAAAASDVILPPLVDRLGQRLQQLEVPPLGAFVITNSARVFQSAEVVLECETEGYDRLALVLEFVKAPGADLAVLQARNISRVVRNRLHAAQFRVNGQPLLLPHRAAVEVGPGDVIEFGETGVSFLVQHVKDRSITSPAAVSLQKYCGVYAEQRLGMKLPVEQALDILWQQQQLPEQQPQPGTPSTAATSAAAAAAAADLLKNDLRSISRLVRSDARSAELELSQLAVQHPAAPGPWFLWGQLAASNRRPWMAAELFRAAAVCQQQQLETVLRMSAAEAAPPPPQQQQQQPPPREEQHEILPVADDGQPAVSSSSSSSEMLAAPVLPATALPAAAAAASLPSSNDSSSSRSSSSRSSPMFQSCSRLVQVLRVWAKAQWDQKLFGSARRLWRLAANVAFKLPYDLAAAAGGGTVLHSWAAAEFDRDNVVNARVVIGEALRKCPKDAAVSSHA